jgi:hypothetical protein
MPPNAMNYLPFLGCAFGFSFSGIFTCASPATASVNVSGYSDTGRPALPAGLVLFFLVCFGLAI